MKKTSAAQGYVIFGLALLLCLCTIPPSHSDGTSPGGLSPVLNKLDDESVMKMKVGTKTLIRKNLSPADIEREKITIGDGRSAYVGALVRRAFRQQDDFAATVRTLGGAGGILAGQPDIGSEIMEFGDSFAVVKSTRIVVSKPSELARVSPLFRSYLRTSRPASRPALASMKAESVEGFRAYLRNELPALPPDDPLRLAARDGDEAVLKAIAEGKGSLEIIDTLIIPKTPLTMSGGIVNDPVSPFRTKHLQLMELFDLDGDLDRRLAANRESGASDEWSPPREVPHVTETGSYRFTAQFLAGFTKAGSWDWERRWNFPSGFFRLTLGASYGIGCRIPLAVEGKIYPTHIVTKDIADKPATMKVEVTASTDDMDAAFFRKTGLPANLVLDGNEAVLEARLYYGYRLRALWTNISHVRNHHTKAFDATQSFAPPLGDSDDGPIIPIPAEATGTSYSLGFMEGSAQIGLKFSGRGKAGLDFAPFMGREKLKGERLGFTSPRAATVTTRLPALQGRADKERYGFTLENPGYSIDLTLTPALKVDVTLGVDWLSRHFDTGWIELNSLGIDVGKASFTRHKGTRKAFTYSDGVKEFRKIDDWTGEIRDGDIVAIQSVCNGLYVTGDSERYHYMHPSSGSIGEKEKFRVKLAGDDRIAFQWLHNGKYIRAGIGGLQLLGAASGDALSWETFKLIKMRDNTYAFQSVQSRKYVRGGGTDRNYLASVSTRIDIWEKFKLWPVAGVTPRR